MHVKSEVTFNLLILYGHVIFMNPIRCCWLHNNPTLIIILLSPQWDIPIEWSHMYNCTMKHRKNLGDTCSKSGSFFFLILWANIFVGHTLKPQPCSQPAQLVLWTEISTHLIASTYCLPFFRRYIAWSVRRTWTKYSWLLWWPHVNTSIYSETSKQTNKRKCWYVYIYTHVHADRHFK